MKGLFLMLAVLQLLQCQLIDHGTYSLGPNLIQNYNFELPVFVAGSMQYFTIPGWTCNPLCNLENTTQTCSNEAKTCIINWKQGLDLCSQWSFDNVSQAISISTAGKYLLRFDWLLPTSLNATGSGFSVSINGTAVVTITITADQSYDWTYHQRQAVLELPVGSNTLSMMQFGTIMDVGFTIANVQLQAIQYPALNFLMNYLVGNNVTTSLNSLPGSRVYFSAILGFLSAFDRLQFYYYHRQNLTYFSERLLSSVNTMALERGSLLQNLIQDCDNSLCEGINNAYENVLGSLDRQKEYSPPGFLEKNENGIGFFANNLEFFFFELPGIIVLYIAFSLLFRLLFNFRVSRLIRKYSFYGVLVFIMFEGSVEQFAFYFFAECRLLYSATPLHKLGRVFMLLFFFPLIIFTVGGLTFFLVHYKKLVKYFMEDCRKVSLLAILLESLEKGIFPLIFGSIHALLLENLLAQTITLGAVEAAYFCVKLVTLGSGTAKYHFKVVMLSLTSLLRLVLIATFYLYQREGSPPLINLIHHDIVWLYIICWAVETLYDIGHFAGDFIGIVRESCQEDKTPKKGRGRAGKTKGRHEAPQKEAVTPKKLKADKKEGKSSGEKEDKVSSKKQKTPSKQKDQKLKKEEDKSSSEKKKTRSRHKDQKPKKEEVREGLSKKKQNASHLSEKKSKDQKPKKEEVRGESSKKKQNASHLLEKNRQESASSQKQGTKSKEKKRGNTNSPPKEKSEEKRVVTVHQNGFNIDVIHLENDNRFQFEGPPRVRRQKSSKKGKEKKSKALHDEKQD